MLCLVVAWKYFTEAFVFLLYTRKKQVQEQSGCKLWFRWNKQMSQFLGQTFICNIYIAHFGF